MRHKSKPFTPSPDYVNVPSIEEKERSQQTVKVPQNQISPSNQRAVPIFIDHLGNEVIKTVNHSNLPPDFLNSSTDHNNSIDRELMALDDPNYSKSNELYPECLYENTQSFRHIQEDDRHVNEEPSPSASHNHSKVESNMTGLVGTNVFVDDQSAGKYSDSGYDTLRHEGNAKKPETMENEPASFQHDQAANEALYDTQANFRQLRQKVNKRPETWSPDKFSDQWSYQNPSGHDEQNEKPTANTFRESLGNIKFANDNSGLSLESPKIVKETQEATQRTSVQDRIRAFSDKMKVDQRSENMSRRKSLDPKLIKYSDSQENLFVENSNEQQKPRKGPRYSDGFIAPLNAEYAISQTSVIKAHEAQVKSLYDYGKKENSSQKEFSNSNNIGSSRINRNDLRKFVFEEEVHDNKKTSRSREDSNLSHGNHGGVKEILQSFENRSMEDLSRHPDSGVISSNHKDFSENHDSSYSMRKESVEAPVSSQSQFVDFNANSDSEVALPPRPPKKPNLGGEMNRGYSSSSKPNLLESIGESVKDKYMGQDRNQWANDQEGQLYANNPMFYSSMDDQNTLSVHIGNPPQEQAPTPPTSSTTSQYQGRSYTVANVEENYLPMSPPKKPFTSSVIAPASSTSSLSSKHLITPEPVGSSLLHDPADFEEHTYIEMNGELSKKTPRPILAPPVSSKKIDYGHLVPQSAESPRYYEIGDKEETQHYEYIYRAASHYESIYMEVPGTAPPLPQTGRDEKPIVPKKPLDLKIKSTSTKSLLSNTSGSNSQKSISNLNYDISSDADDEASKDFESIEPPKNKRFSLSDTFRPASYYLSGAEPSSDPDAHDSSDSDLVSPPPIPTSPPPLDELDNDSKTFDYDNLMTPEPPPHLKNALNTSRNLRSNRRHSKDSSSSQQSSSIKDTRNVYSMSNLNSDKYKRRPVFEESLESLQNEDSFILGSEDHYPVSSAYPEFNHLGPVQRDRTSSRSSHDIMFMREKTNIPSFRSKSSLDHNSSFNESSYLHRHDQMQSDAGFSSRLQQSVNGSSNFSLSSSSQMLNGRSPSSSRIAEELSQLSIDSQIRSPDPYAPNNCDEATYQNFPLSVPFNVSSNSNLSNADLNNSVTAHGEVGERSIIHLRSTSDLSNRSLLTPSSGSVNNLGPVHTRDNSTVSVTSETSPRSAPYYYSDVIRDAPESDRSIAASRSQRYQLNNQRDLEASKRQDIGRKVNHLSNSSTPFDQRKLASELQASAHIFEKSSGTPDDRNVYVSDTLKKMKRSITPNFGVDTKNVYPHGLSLKSDSATSLTGTNSSHRRTRSLEGLMEESSRSPTDRDSSENFCEPNQRGYLETQSPVFQRGVVTPVSGSQSSDLAGREPSISGSHRQVHSSNHYSLYSNETDVNDSENVASDTVQFQRENNWEDDNEWVDQLRRASLRHTRSLETLDEPKRSIIPCDSTSPTGNTFNGTEKDNGRLISPAHNLDEYRVDYREGLINPVERNPALTETLERTRRGLTCLEGYEWDPAEEKFTKPAFDASTSSTNNSSTAIGVGSAEIETNQTFLDDGLPPPQTTNIDRPSGNEGDQNFLNNKRTNSNKQHLNQLRRPADHSSQSHMREDGFRDSTLDRFGDHRGEGRLKTSDTNDDCNSEQQKNDSTKSSEPSFDRKTKQDDGSGEYFFVIAILIF